MPLDDPGAPGQGQAGGHCVEVLAEGAGEALQGFRGVVLGLPDPFQQQVSVPVADQIGEGPGEVAGAGDVRAGEPDLGESLVLPTGECLGGSHDPGSDLVCGGG